MSDLNFETSSPIGHNWDIIEAFRKVPIAYELVLVCEKALGEQEDRENKNKPERLENHPETE